MNRPDPASVSSRHGDGKVAALSRGLSANRGRALRIGAAIYIGLNLGLAAYSLSHGVPLADDWALWSALPAAMDQGKLYATDTVLPMVWSPVMGWVMSAVVLGLGYWPWAALHVVVLALLRDPLLIVLALVSWAFWMDVASANTFVFVFVAGALAVGGSRIASLAYLALFLLMPRPVQIPLAIWLLMRRPSLRIPFALLAASHSLFVLMTGYAADWIGAMTSYAANPIDLGPGHWIGAWWLLLGVPVAALFMLKGHHGWAGLSLSPYLLPQYLLMPLVELGHRTDRRAADGNRSLHHDVPSVPISRRAKET